MNRTTHYEDKSPHYGIGHTRLERILALVRGMNRAHMRILDVGCAGGRLGQELKKLGHAVVGIDISSQAVAQARSVLDAAYVCDIENEWPNSLGGPFDCVILSEVLEHVFDPVALLRQARRFLSPQGRIIITTPNFMTWTNRIRFLFGDFRYQDQGMFDFGHIRWFTYRYLKEMLAAAGFDITDERHIIFPGKLTGVLRFWPSMFAWQFVLEAEKR